MYAEVWLEWDNYADLPEDISPSPETRVGELMRPPGRQQVLWVLPIPSPPREHVRRPVCHLSVCLSVCPAVPCRAVLACQSVCCGAHPAGRPGPDPAALAEAIAAAVTMVMASPEPGGRRDTP